MNTDVASLAASRTSSWVNRRDGVAVALLGFAVALAFFLLVPPFFRDEVGLAAGFTGQEAADLLTPVVTLALFALAIELTGRGGTWLRVVLVAIVGLWVAGQAIHLAANAIGDVYDSEAARRAFYATPGGALAEWLDEVLSHWLWHVGWLGLMAVLLWVGLVGRPDGTASGSAANAAAGLAGVIHGFTWYVVTDEGATWQLAIPASVVLLALGLLVRRRDGSGSVVTTFVVVGSALSLALYAVWVVIAGWPPASIIEHFKLL